MTCLLILLTLPFTESKFLILMKSSLSIISFTGYTFGFVSKKLSPYPRSYRFSPQLLCFFFQIQNFYLGHLYILSLWWLSISLLRFCIFFLFVWSMCIIVRWSIFYHGWFESFVLRSLSSQYYVISLVIPFESYLS